MPNQLSFQSFPRGSTITSAPSIPYAINPTSSNPTPTSTFPTTSSPSYPYNTSSSSSTSFPSTYSDPQSSTSTPSSSVPLYDLSDEPDDEDFPYFQPDTSSRPLTFVEKVKEKMFENNVVVNTFIAGGIAGATSRTVVSPLERLKIILQCQAVKTSTVEGVSGQAYSGVWASLGRMWKEEGFRGFMKGNGINVVRILPYSALQFTSYGAFKKWFSAWSGQESLNTPLRLAAGASAGIVAVSATYPLDLVRARLSLATANMAVKQGGAAFSAEDAKLGILGMTKKVYRTEGGIKGLYRGSWATAVGVAPYVSLNFYIYESLRSLLLPATMTPMESDSGELAVRKLACGGLAGATSLLFTHPFDVIRRKLQITGLKGAAPEYNGAVDAIRKIIRAEGFWKGMYRGLTPNIIKVAPSIAVSFYTFETVRDWLAYWEHSGDDHLV